MLERSPPHGRGEDNLQGVNTYLGYSAMGPRGLPEVSNKTAKPSSPGCTRSHPTSSPRPSQRLAGLSARIGSASIWVSDALGLVNIYRIRVERGFRESVILTKSTCR